MIKKYKFCLIIFCFGILKLSNAQLDVQKLQAKDFIKYEDYTRGLEAYLKLYKTAKEDLEINYYIGFKERRF